MMFIEVDTMRPPIAEQTYGTFVNGLSYICRDRIISSFVLNSLGLKEKKSHFTSCDKMFNLYLSAFELNNIHFNNTKSTSLFLKKEITPKLTKRTRP